MPRCARAAPLVGEMAVFATAALHGRRVVYAPHGSGAAAAPPTQAQLEEYVKLTGARPRACVCATCAGRARTRTTSRAMALTSRAPCPCAASAGQNTTAFSASEKNHPINVFEQVNVCIHCGCERFLSTRPTQCCEGGRLLLDRAMPPRLLSIIAGAPGLSKQSRCANSLFRFAQMALPKGTHRIPDHFQHLKVTGVPYALVNNLNEPSSTRSFLEDPDQRLEARDRYASDVRPSTTVLKTIDAVLRSSNPLVTQLVNWSAATATEARLVLKWPGSTTSVRAFSVDPSGDIRGERCIFFTRRDEDRRCTIRSSNPAYAPMMWPLAFPDGMPAALAATSAYPGQMLDDAESFGLSRRTMALLMQPERDGRGGECITLERSWKLAVGTSLAGGPGESGERRERRAVSP